MVEVHNQVQKPSQEIEGKTYFSNDFTQPVETVVTYKRFFTVPGHLFELRLFAQNELVPEDQATLIWDVLCANPIVPAHWNLDYPTSMRPDSEFKFKMSIAAGNPLPTMPTLVIYPIEGRQVVNSGVKIDRSNPLSFYVVGTTLGPVTSCNKPVDTCQSYTFDKVGIEPQIVTSPAGMHHVVTRFH